MSSPPAAGEPQHYRASDADREKVANLLREAAGDGRLTMDELDERLDAVYAAKTYAELQPITTDLPGTAAAYVPALTGPGASGVRQYGGEAGSHVGVAILGAFSRRGKWLVPKSFTSVALLGGIELDMRDASFVEPTVNIHVTAIMGGVEITVPQDASVRVTGIGIMGAFEDSTSEAVSPGGPMIIISGVAIMGGVEVRRRPPRKDKLSPRSPRELG